MMDAILGDVRVSGGASEGWAREAFECGGLPPLWSGQLAGSRQRPRRIGWDTASKLAGRKRQQAAALKSYRRRPAGAPAGAESSSPGRKLGEPGERGDHL